MPYFSSVVLCNTKQNLIQLATGKTVLFLLHDGGKAIYLNRLDAATFGVLRCYLMLEISVFFFKPNPQEVKQC